MLEWVVAHNSIGGREHTPQQGIRYPTNIRPRQDPRVRRCLQSRGTRDIVGHAVGSERATVAGFVIQ